MLKIRSNQRKSSGRIPTTHISDEEKHIYFSELSKLIPFSVLVRYWLYMVSTSGVLPPAVACKRLETGGNPKQMAWHHPVHDAGAHHQV